jgi:hypothetical protein
MSSALKSDAALTPQETAKASTLAAKLLQQREQRSEEFEKKLKQIEAASRQPVVRDDKFVSAEKVVDYEAEFKAKTVGLERQEAELRIQLKKEWEIEQERVKKDKIEVTYSWWDGSGHRRVIVVPKGTPIGRFLEWVRQDLIADFPALKTTSSDSMMYVKEDCIIPHHISFYDLILNKARGKSGPLFQFDVHDDIRLKADARIEKDESHPGKVVERRWYEKNKHLFPASRWEEFDLAKQRTEGYTIRGGEVNSRRS